MDKQSLFISYCWKDGNTYADELETQLKDEFDVQRDKSQLIANDDIYEFMGKIASCDNVILVVTAEYVKSLNCMLEMSYLVSQDDWQMKAMVLVIDDSLYLVENKIKVIDYWLSRQKRTVELGEDGIGKSLLDEEKEYIDCICNNLETFFLNVSRRKNPSQIAIVNEVIKKSRSTKAEKQELIDKGEKAVLDFLSKNGEVTVRDLSLQLGKSQASVMRFVSKLLKDGSVVRTGNSHTYTIRKNDWK
ncbi:TIR domain-containing protein [Pseudoflavonifractor phocaeensis]|uniref:TIR domain-containing protein n=1 Tax=Pseudoflavonifractor phocaeensis TaxID=1870988 RepID=UPI00195AB77C|nr:TIR domain-containing protein [Pseudoflavonifractor phocaeensis]MBM6926846.1 TIR domain-containing protein [Pseudoflavonifractor phocaeensis]